MHLDDLNELAETDGAQSSEQPYHHGHEDHVDLLGLPETVVDVAKVSQCRLEHRVECTSATPRLGGVGTC